MESHFLYYLLGAIFVIGYAFIALEHNLRINKSGTAIVLGSLLWLIVDIYSGFSKETGHALSEETIEIFSIVIFLLSAMTVVEVLVHYKFFDWIQELIMQKKFSQTGLWWFLGLLTFFMSAVLDNLTTTLIMIQIGRNIYKDKNNLLLFVANTVIAANAGGAFSPIGDVTTIMLWLANKFSALEIITKGFLPSIVAWIIPQYLLGRKLKTHEEAELAHPDYDIIDEKKVQPYWSIVLVGLFSFALPVIFNLIGLPPFLGLLSGVGLLWIVIDLRFRNSEESNEEGRIVSVIQKTDLATLKFFIGILLAVGALSHSGLLAIMNENLFGHELESFRLITGNIVLGFTSAILDNVPLVAAAIKMLPAAVPVDIWVLLAMTAGTGGSMLVIGSAAGVAAMGQIKELNFTYYLKNISFPALLGYIGSIAVWYLFYTVL
jgi:Na+/H+ antiporter NhaD/arsenite permease-like protein